MSVTPFIRPIRTAGGTLYTFSSAAEDLTLYTLNKDNRKFKFSKFALLNIPDIKHVYAETGATNKNYIQFDTILGNFDMSPVKSANTNLAESFQNYVLNLETMIRYSDDYNTDVFRTHTERVFWKWMKEIGAVRFNEATSENLSSEMYGAHFIEEEQSDDYNRVVKYIGDLGLSNSVKHQKNAFYEVYAHVPGEHGSISNPLFYSIEDANYYPGKIISNQGAGAGKETYLFGRSIADTHPEGLSIQAHFDSEAGTLPSNLWYYSEEDGEFVNYESENFKWHFSEATATPFSYILEQEAFKDPRTDRFGIGDNPYINGENKWVEFQRSRLDGITLQTEESRYEKIANNPKIKNFSELASSAFASNFEFNAVLVYYDLYDKENPEDRVRNLYGVLFLDNADPLFTGSNQGTIPRLQKIKPNPLTGDNGNAYSFKINLKFDTNTIDASVQTSVNDYNTFSMELYLDALNNMKGLIEKYQDANNHFVELSSEVEDIKSQIYNKTQQGEIIQRLTELENKFEEKGLNLIMSANDLQSLIERNYKEIQNIYKNKTSIDVAYNLDVIRAGDGLKIDRTSDRYIVLKPNKPLYNLGENPLIKISEDFTVKPEQFIYEQKLNKFTNYLKIMDGETNTPLILDRNIVINFDDSEINWERGQSVILSIKNGLDLDNVNGRFNLRFNTNKEKIGETFQYTKLIDIFDADVFTNKNHKPRFEIVCIDPDNYIFETEVI